MFTQLWDKDALQRSMNKSTDNEYDGFDHIRQNMDNALGMISSAAKGVSKISDVAMDIQDAAESVNKVTSRQQRTSSEAGLSIGKDGSAKVRRITQTTPVGHSTLAHVQTGIGATGTQVIGNSTAPPIRLSLGKQLTPSNSIDNFLSLMNGSGSVSVAFGGRLLCAQDQRIRHYEAFRHNLHASDGIYEGAAYPATADIMTPSGDLTINLQGAYTGSPTIPNTQIRDIQDASVYFSLYNKADLEDLSFNLNKFKIGPQTDVTFTAADGAPYVTVNGGAPKIQLLDDVLTLQSESHRAFSAIHINNTRQWVLPSPTTGKIYSGAPYRYDSVFKQGTVDYLFMNKGESPLELEVVVYRVKKNGVQGVPSSFDDLDIPTQLEQPITRGMMTKTLGAIGTDLIDDADDAAHTPIFKDWITNPSRPFLPKNRFIDQSSTPYIEESRVKLVIQSGQRRPFQLKLGGHQYDPANLVLRKKSGSSADAASNQPIFDEHSYIVCMAMNGIAMSRQLGGQTGTAAPNEFQLTTGPVIGDVFASADLQWYAQYTEQVGAMSYKKVRDRNIFTYGGAPSMKTSLRVYNEDIAVEKSITSTPVALLTQSQAVRIPQTPINTQHGPDFSLGTQQTQAATGGVTENP